MIYIFIQGSIREGAESLYKKYLDAVGPLMKEYGAEVVLVGEGINSEYGTGVHGQNAVLSLPDEDALNGFLGDPRYLKIKEEYRDKAYDYLNLTFVRGRPPRSVD